MRWTLAALLTVPLAEFIVAILVGRQIGAGLTIVLLIAVSIAGGMVIKRAGMRSLSRLDANLAEGRTPEPELADTGMVLVAGLLLFFPGFVTGVLGLLLLIPPVRALARRPLEQRLKQAAANRVTFFSNFTPGFGRTDGRIDGRTDGPTDGRTHGVVITGEVIDAPEPPARPREPGDPTP